MKTIRGTTQGLTIDIPNDPANFGLMKFNTLDEKIKFYKLARQKKERGELESDVFFTDKKSWEDRVAEKKMGYIKHHLMSHYNKTKENIKINWRKRYVEMNGKKVASLANGTWSYHKTMKPVEQLVEASINAWMESRDSADPPSESD